LAARDVDGFTGAFTFRHYRHPVWRWIAMNMADPLAFYASICKATGRPSTFWLPGQWESWTINDDARSCQAVFLGFQTRRGCRFRRFNMSMATFPLELDVERDCQLV